MHSFNDLPLAFWTSIVGVANTTVDRNEDGDDPASRRSSLLKAEWAMRDRDAQMIRRAKTCNAIEARILESRLARGGRHGGLLPSTDEFATYLDGADGWLFSDEYNNPTPEEMESQWDDIGSRTEEMCAAYYAAKHEYALENDSEMEEGARAAAAERAATEGGGGGTDGEDNNEDNHDTQWLPMKRQMEITMKNKNEANKLFLGDLEL